MAPTTDPDPGRQSPGQQDPGRRQDPGHPEQPGADESAPLAELMRSMREHPSRMPELLAVFGVRHRGPRAARRVAKLRAAHPEATERELAQRSVDHARRVSQNEGAFVAGPFLWMAPFAFCSALLAQGQLLLELAALAGKDPTDRARAPELLVLQGAHPDLAAAERALAAGPPPDEGPATRLGRFRGFGSLLWRMARLLGLTSEDVVPPPSRWRTAGEWGLLALVFLVGFVAPLIWLPYMAFSYNRATDRLAARGVAFHFGGESAGWPPPRGTRTDPGLVVATARAVFALFVPIAAVGVLAVADIRLADSRWPALALVLVVLSVVVSGLWWMEHWRSLHPRRSRPKRTRGRSASAPRTPPDEGSPREG
ncbi:hypothetical protein ACFVFS_04640 [Kitasatospora sp. NPDC057692]|uniref:hypothetical protein n=1 Tax=Kitasatospora sp. NPDC057692 TaxID=3346215 RepID=UPI00367B4B40